MKISGEKRALEKGRRTKAMEKPKVQSIIEFFYLQLELSLPLIAETYIVQRVFPVDTDKETLWVV